MLSGLQPSNQITLGNYIGAVKNWASNARDYDCLFFAVDLHAITLRQDPQQLREQTYRALAVFLASGLESDDLTLFAQSHVSEHAELAWVLNCFSYMGELSRMTQFKDKSAKQGQNIPVGIFTYPLLMAADILLYDAHYIPVGADQKQHVELTRDVAIRMNNLYSRPGSELFVIPEPVIPKVGAKIMSLQDPTAKMSKSDPDPLSAIYLSDTNDQILKKFKKAVTDSGSEITFDAQAKPGVANLLTIQSALTGKSIESLVDAYSGKQYGHLKIETAECVIQTLGPIRDRAALLMQDRSHLDDVLARGAERARKRAAQTLARVYDRVGFIPRRG